MEKINLFYSILKILSSGCRNFCIVMITEGEHQTGSLIGGPADVGGGATLIKGVTVIRKASLI